MVCQKFQVAFKFAFGPLAGGALWQPPPSNNKTASAGANAFPIAKSHHENEAFMLLFACMSHANQTTDCFPAGSRPHGTTAGTDSIQKSWRHKRLSPRADTFNWRNRPESD